MIMNSHDAYDANLRVQPKYVKHIQASWALGLQIEFGFCIDEFGLQNFKISKV